MKNLKNIAYNYIIQHSNKRNYPEPYKSIMNEIDYNFRVLEKNFKKLKELYNICDIDVSCVDSVYEVYDVFFQMIKQYELKEKCLYIVYESITKKRNASRINGLS